jgi:hypothetical protein
MRLVLTFLFLIVCFFGFSQQTNELIKDEFKPKAIKGTFQLIFLTSNADPVILTTELLQFINYSRLENNDTTIPLTQNVNVFIPSTRKINNPEFQPLVEFVISTE